MSSTIRQVFDLPKHTPVYIGRQDFVVTYAAGKSVLHLGCADAGFSQQKFDSGLFLHARLQKVAKSLWGVDVDTAGLDWMSSQGWQNLYHLDIERLETEPRILAESFDLLVLTEVLEHLNNPGRFLEAIRPLFHFQTELLISTPNATSLSNIIANLHHQESVHPEHNFWFSYHTLGSMLNKYGYQIRQFALYSQYDYTQPWIGKFLPSPARVHLSLNLDRQVQPARVEKQDNINGYRRPKIGGWLRANTQAAFYGLGLKQWPFFADGILAVVCLAD